MEDREVFIAALEETIELLQEELSRYRRSNKLLRIINHSLRRQQVIAHENDEMFKDMCAQDIETNMEPRWDGLSQMVAS